MTIHLQGSSLVFDNSDYHPDAFFSLNFQRTFRIPDDGNDHFLPPGFEEFPLEHVEDHAERLPESWVSRGGVFFPMCQAEAMWIWFRGSYPFALKIASGKINCVDGKPWSMDLQTGRKGKSRVGAPRQNYVVVTEQLWLDGFSVEEGVIRQFIAMPLGQGYTVEEQVTGEAAWGGLQFVAYPLKRERYVEMLERQRHEEMLELERNKNGEREFVRMKVPMGFGMGGRMRQQIMRDPFNLDDWEISRGERCFVSILNSHDWASVTGHKPPTNPVTAQDYADAGLPWFDYYADKPATEGSDILRGLKSVGELSKGLDDDLAKEMSMPVPISKVVKLPPPSYKPDLDELDELEDEL